MSTPITHLAGTSAWSDYTNSNVLNELTQCMNRYIENSSEEYWKFNLKMSEKTLANIFMHPEIQQVLMEYPDTHYFYKMFKHICIDKSLNTGLVIIEKDNITKEFLKVL